MADTKVFHDITPAIFACVKTKSKEEHGTVYKPPDGNSGTATTETSLYFVELSFNFDPKTGDLTYTLIKKSWIVPIAEVWNGIAKTIDSCKSVATAADGHVFEGVTPAIFSCVKIKSKEEHGTVYKPADGNSGTATTETMFGIVELGFNFDPQSGKLAYTVIKKGWLIPINEVWNGIAKTIQSCSTIQ